jgi:hypothetical protein
MRITYFLAVTVCVGLLASAAAARADVKYFTDPPHKSLSEDDPPPMLDMAELAEQGDTRAMFILGDMSEKGKGGLVQDRKKAREWFEKSAMHGYSQSFIRLAAMAKHDNNPREAWQWYTLAIHGFGSGDAQDYAIQARKELVKAAGLTPEEVRVARDATDDWEDARDKYLRAEKKAEAEKERQEREQARKEERAREEAAEDEEDSNGDVAKTEVKTKQDKQSGQQESEDEQN